ncbi:hypothetical protein BJY01DRAFT_128738 [Aspergillus pseudoustus]|uniref:Uncharacterized protein n=1 Tax=Aspergillus pseudoustus TaxID=1810923 RepID=A0ABR4IM13_9EURO
MACTFPFSLFQVDFHRRGSVCRWDSLHDQQVGPSGVLRKVCLPDMGDKERDYHPVWNLFILLSRFIHYVSGFFCLLQINRCWHCCRWHLCVSLLWILAL